MNIFTFVRMEKLKGIRAFRLLAMALMLVATVSCGRFEDIKITSCRVQSLSPHGLSSADAILEIGVHNPTMAFTVTDIRGAVLHEQTDTAAVFTGGPVSVEKKSDNVYPVPFSASLVPPTSILKLAAVVGSGDYSAYSINLELDVQLKNGMGKTVCFDDLNLNDLLNSESNQ